MQVTVDPGNDVAPFTDIRVRKALQMAIDLPSLAKNYYGGSARSLSVLTDVTVFNRLGPALRRVAANLKDEYAYNPTAAKSCCLMPVIPADLKLTWWLFPPMI